MKKKAYKTPAGGAFRNYFYGNRMTNGCTIRKVRNNTVCTKKENETKMEA